MDISSKLDQLHLEARKNKWLGYFAIFNRITLAAGFLPSGMQKVLGERFTVLAVNHPMGNFLEAFFPYGLLLHFCGNDAGSCCCSFANSPNRNPWCFYLFSNNSEYLHSFTGSEV